MPSYPLMYRLGMTPWERYGDAAVESIAAVLDRERAEATDPRAGRSILAAAARSSPLSWSAVAGPR